MSDSPWAALFQLAAGQWALVARRQARDVGISDRTFTRRVRSEDWRQPYRGVYLLPGATWGPMPRASAALLATGSHAAATGIAALHIHGVADRQPPRLTLVIPHDRRAPSLRAVDVARSRTLRDDDVNVVAGLRCTTPERAFLDAASRVSDEDLRGLLIDGRQRRIVEPGRVVERAMISAHTLPGRRRLIAAALEVDDVGADSVLSHRVHRRLISEGLRPDPVPVAIDVGGRRLHPDITFEAMRVCIECDSLAHHRDQRALDLDHRKDQAYMAAGWRCLRLGWRRYDHDWEGFVAAVRHALDEWPRIYALISA